jgi:hypothetical protein
MNTFSFTKSWAKYLVLTAILVMTAMPAFAAPIGILTLQGTIPGILEITVVAQPTATALDLSVNVQNLLIAHINEKSKRKAGYTVTLTAANSGSDSGFFFKSSDAGNNDVLVYTLTYDGLPVSLVSGVAIITDANQRSSTADGITKEIKISYNGADSFLNEDTYSDTLTFTITAK